MRIFVTGATGFIGSAIVQELIQAGHQVLGLTRSDAGAKALTAAGAEVHRGNLEDLDSLRSGAANADGVIHTAFNHDFSNFQANCESDRLAIEAMGSVLVGSDRPFVVTSGIGILTPNGQLAVETDRPVPGTNPRIASEEAADTVAAMGVRVSVLRLPPSVHGTGDYGFVPIVINMAREKGVSVYKGEGTNRWPAVHRFDAAQLYRLVLEHTAAPGTRFHAVADEGVAYREIAEAIGNGLSVPVVSESAEGAAAHFSWFANFAAIDCPASSQQTRTQLGWQPTQPGLLADLNGGSYFLG